MATLHLLVHGGVMDIHGATLWETRRKSIRQSPTRGTPQEKNILSFSKPLDVRGPVSGEVSQEWDEPRLTCRAFSSTASAQYAVSHAQGTVDSVTEPVDGHARLTVILIKDVHRVRSAQRNIAGIIDSLIRKNKIDFIGLEGSFGPIDLKRFRDFPDREVIKQAADHLLDSHEISGPIHTAFTSPVLLPPFIGIDDREHYNAHVRAVQQSHRLRNLLEEKLKCEGVKS